MEIQEITKYIDFLLSLATPLCGNSQDAQDLVQETILAALTYRSRGGVIQDYKTWLSAVLKRKFYDMLRVKYKRPTVTISEDFDLSSEEDFVSDIIRAQEAETVRREIAFLSHTYRDILVRHYFLGQAEQQIATELNIPQGTVKSRLSFGRQQLKKGITHMKNYTENSYAPQHLDLRNSGSCGMNEEPMSLTEGDTLAQNLLILSYEKPLTITELSKAIGVASAYVEPVVNKLVEGELMKRMGDGKVYTDFIIYHAEDYVKYIKEQEAFAATHAEAYFAPLREAIQELKDTTFYSLPLERFLMIQIAASGLYNSQEGIRKPQIFPDRPNGGKWIAFGTIHPENYVIPTEKRGKEEYLLSGRRCTSIDSYLEAHNLKLYNYETSLDATAFQKHSGYGFTFYQDVEYNMLKLFYLIKHGIVPQSVDLDERILKGIPLLCDRGFLSMESGQPQVLIPCLTHHEEAEFLRICKKATNAFAKSIREPLAAYCGTHKMKIPAHLKSVPDQKLTMPYEPGPMMFVYEAINKGLHPRDLGYPCPETIAVFD